MTGVQTCALPIYTASQISVTATPQNILVSAAKVNVSNKAFNIDNQSLDVEDIGSDVTDHLSSGSIVFDVTNPFGVAMTATVRINYPQHQNDSGQQIPAGSVVKSVSMTSAPTSTV